MGHDLLLSCYHIFCFGDGGNREKRPLSVTLSRNLPITGRNLAIHYWRTYKHVAGLNKTK